jgi:hypothetical protein
MPNGAQASVVVVVGTTVVVAPRPWWSSGRWSWWRRCASSSSSRSGRAVPRLWIEDVEVGGAVVRVVGRLEDRGAARDREIASDRLAARDTAGRGGSDTRRAAAVVSHATQSIGGSQHLATAADIIPDGMSRST